MPESYKQVNFMENGQLLMGEYFDAAIQAAVDLHNVNHEKSVVNFQTLVDRQNFNDTYSSEVEAVSDYFKSKNLEINPLRVVGREVVTSAYVAAGQNPNELEEDGGAGRNVNGRALIIEDKVLIDTFGPDDYILNIGLHEAAHSLYAQERVLRTVTDLPDNRTKLGGFVSSGLVKADLRRSSETTMVGDFWNEAFADLTRVRALRELRRSNNVAGDKHVPINGTLVSVIPNTADKDDYITNSKTILLPAEYALFAKTSSDGKDTVSIAPSNLAAYALDLLDNSVPGIYDDLLAATQDPKRQADAIRKIESIQPGLYSHLRDLDYTEKDFITGLQTVVSVLSAMLAVK